MEKGENEKPLTISHEVMSRKHKQRLSVAQTQAIVNRNPALQGIFKPKRKEEVDDDATGEGLVFKSRNTSAIADEVIAPIKVKEKRRSGSWVGSTVGDDTVDDDAPNLTVTKPSTPSGTSSSTTKKEKRRIALSLASLAAKPEARANLVKKGAIAVLIDMSMLPDRSVQRSSVLAFSALSKEPSIRGQMIEEGAMASIVTLSSLMNNVIAFEACRALCNLCIEPNSEIRAIKDGVPFALMHALGSFPNCIDVCLRAFLNLSCVSEKYPRIEEISDALMHFNNYALSIENEIAISSALCNLAALKSFQLRLVEDGCLRFVERVIKSPITRLRVLAGKIIENLTSDSRTRSKMVDNGIINILLSTSKDESEDVRTSSVKAFYNLALSDSCRVRIVNANAVRVIVQICSDKIQNVSLGRMASRILQLLCSDSRIVSKLVKDGIIKALMNLLSSDDEVIGQKCAEAICSLFQIEDVKGRLIEQGAVSILIKLSEATMMAITSEWCSFALYHLTVSSQCPLNVLEAAILPCVIKLCDQQTSSNTRYFCAASLSHVSSLTQVDSSIAIPVLVLMLKSDVDNNNMKALCASALYNLASDDKHCHIMLEHGALMPVVRLTAAGDTSTKMKCAAILSRLSLEPEFHVHFATGDVLRVLLELSSIDDIYTQRKVIIAISNLCQTEILRNQLLTLNPIQYLMTLSSKCDEYVRRGCASIVCNLAFASGTEKAIADTGIVETLLIVAMITSDQLDTKIVCVKALVNLMADPSLFRSMVEKGLIWGISSLAVLDNAEIRLLCLKALTTLSKNFSHEMLSSTPCIRTVAKSVQLGDLELCRYGVRTLFNLLIKSTDRDLDFRRLAVMSMGHLIACPDVEINEACVMCLCLASQSELCREDIVRAGLLRNIDASSIFNNIRICSAYLTMFENIALNPHSREDIVDEQCVKRFLQICSLNNRELNNTTGRALYFISCHEQNIRNLINQNVLVLIDQLLEEIDYEGPDEELSRLLVATLYNFSTVESVQAQLVQQNIVRTLFKLWESALEDFQSCSLVIKTVAHLACGNINTQQLMQGGAARLLCFVGQTSSACYPACDFEFELSLLERVSVAFRNVLSVISNQELLVAAGCIPVIVELANSAKELINQTSQEAALPPRPTIARYASMTMTSTSTTSLKLPSIIDTSTNSSSNNLGILTKKASMSSMLATTASGKSAAPVHALAMQPHAYKRAQPEHTLILNHCISALRSLTYNPQFRTLLVDSGAMGIILDDDSDGIPLALLIDLERESWQNGSRGPQKEARVTNKKPDDLYLALLGHTKVLDVNDVVVVSPTLEKFYVRVDVDEIQRASTPAAQSIATPGHSTTTSTPLGSARSGYHGLPGTSSSATLNMLSPRGTPRVSFSKEAMAILSPKMHHQVVDPRIPPLELGIDDLKKYEDPDDSEGGVMFCPKQDANDCELKLDDAENLDDTNSPLSPVSPGAVSNPHSPMAHHAREMSMDRMDKDNSGGAAVVVAASTKNNHTSNGSACQSDDEESDDEHNHHHSGRLNSLPDVNALSSGINPNAAGSALAVVRRPSTSGARRNAILTSEDRRKSRRDSMINRLMKKYSHELDSSRARFDWICLFKCFMY